MERQFKDYGKGNYLGSGKDMAHHTYDAYKVEDEIHIVYASGHVVTKNIRTIKDNMDSHLWTPFVEWV